MTIDRQAFFNGVRRLFTGGLKQPQVVGMSAILDEWDQRLPNGDIRWLAYMLATTFHETNQQMLPVREAYWLSEDWRRRNLRYYPYYGRGFVQLTWAANYAKAGAYVRADLVRNPDLALRPDYAAAIMFVGMGEGWFRADEQGRRHTLPRYFNARTNDPIGARAIINGREVRNGVLIAAVTARYHAAFLGALGARATAPGAFDPLVVATARMDLPYAETAYANLAEGGAELATSAPSWMDGGSDTTSIAALPHESENARRRMELVAQIVTGFVTANSLAPSELPSLMRSVQATLEDLERPGGLDRPEPDSGADESIDLQGESPEERAAEAPILIPLEEPPPTTSRGRRRGSGEGVGPTPAA